MSNGEIYDVAIIGAGAAGLAAARRIAPTGLKVTLLEGRPRAGGRALTCRSPYQYPIDLGCGWLHSADQNPLSRAARPAGLTVDVTPPPSEQR